MLELHDLHAFYGKSHVLHGVNLSIRPGCIMALLGRNGSGRSTTAKAIMGAVHGTGSVRWKGQEILGRRTYEIAHLGIGYVPEERDIFPRLTVHQNLMLGQKSGQRSTNWDFEDMYALFPRLKERQHTEAGVLSGGEQQMLAMARALMAKPRVLLLDEPSMGLSPVMVEKIFDVIREVSARGVTILLVEQNARLALQAADRGYVMESGMITSSAAAAELLDDPAVRAAYLGE